MGALPSSGNSFGKNILLDGLAHPPPFFDCTKTNSYPELRLLNKISL